jgi:hypothetical protein
MRINTISKFVTDIITNPISIIELPEWYKYQKEKDIKSPFDFKIPWMTFGAIKYLDKYLDKNMTIFEYGSGGSTIFFSERVKKIISIEHDSAWYDYEINILNKLENVELNLILPENKGKLINYRKGYGSSFFDNYVNLIEQYNIKFDVIIVDGRQRNDCFKKAIQKIAHDGIIVFDNFDREYYKKSMDFININEFEVLNFKGFVPFGNMQSLTTIFRKI